MKRALAVSLLALAGCAHERDTRPWVHRLVLNGVRSVDRTVLADGLAVEPTPWWNLRGRRLYDDLLLDADRDRILRFYQSNGYFNTEITIAEARPRVGDASVDVVFGVDEGVPSLIDDVRVLGTDTLDDETRRSIEDAQFALRRGQRFIHPRYVAMKDAFLGTMKAHGYAFALVDGNVVVDRAAAKVKIEIRIDPGPRYAIGRLELVTAAPSGDKTSTESRQLTTMRLGTSDAMPVDPRLLERTFGVPPGRTFKLADLDEGRGRVLALGIFTNVNMSYHADPDRPDVVDVRLRLGGASLNEVRLGGGIGIEAQRNEIRLSLQYTRRNFLGGLRTFELRLRPAYVVVPAVWDAIVRHGPALTADAIFTQPKLGPFSKLTLTLGYDVGVEYAYQYEGPRLQAALVRLLWHDRVSLGASYNFQFLDFFDTAPEILADPSQAGARYGYTDPYRLGWWQEDVRFDWRDDRLEPRRGVYAELSAEEGGAYAGGAFTYEKLKAGLRGYVPLGKRVVVAARAELGQMWSQGDESTPITRRLYLGGANSHRGFTEGRLSPQIAVSGSAPLPIGGDQSFLVSGEVRVDLFRIVGSMLVFGGFVDAGDVGRARGDTISGWRSGVDFAHLHTAVGGGLRYRTPIGTVRADVGVRVNRVDAMSYGEPNPDPGERVAFHISLAEAF